MQYVVVMLIYQHHSYQSDHNGDRMQVLSLPQNYKDGTDIMTA